MTSRLIKRAPSRSNLDPTAAGKHYVHAEPWYAVGSMETDSISEPTVPVNGAHATDSGRGSKALLHEDAPRKSGLLYQASDIRPATPSRPPDNPPEGTT